MQSGNWLPDEDILTWPAQGTGNYTRNMAPFVDVNNNGIYDPLVGGDYPQIKGDQMLYWIFNDNFYNHNDTTASPLKVEIHASAYAFICPLANNADSAINYTTFYNYKVINRSSLTYNNSFIGNFLDFDIGNPYDDAIGCNPLYNISYSYNYDEYDETDIGYGVNPPLVGNTILNGPEAIPNDSIDNDNDGLIDEIGEKCLLTSSISFKNNASVTGNPFFSSEIYSYLQCKWKDGNHLNYGGNGYDTSNSNLTNFMYPSSPPFDSTSWHSYANPDVRIIQGTGPFTFLPGSSFDYDFAVVYARHDTTTSPSPHLFQQLFSNADSAKSWFDNNTFPSCLEINAGVTETKKSTTNKVHVFPNPAQNTISFQLEKSEIVKNYTIYNLLGDEIMVNNLVNSQSIDISSLSNGVYFFTLQNKEGKVYNSKFVKR